MNDAVDRRTVLRKLLFVPALVASPAAAALLLTSKAPPAIARVRTGQMLTADALNQIIDTVNDHVAGTHTR